MLTAMQQSQAQTAGLSIDSCIAYAIRHSTAVASTPKPTFIPT